MLDSPLSDWTSIDSLAKWFPNLTSLRFLSSQDPPSPPHADEDARADGHADADARAHADADPRRIPSDPAKARPFLIAKLPGLSQLNSTPVSSNERRDAELFYVGFVGRQATTAGWARYEELCELHGRPVRSEARTGDSSLKSRMISGFRVSFLCLSVVGRAGDGAFLRVEHGVTSMLVIVTLPRTGLMMSTLTPH